MEPCTCLGVERLIVRLVKFVRFYVAIHWPITYGKEF